jgi:hypothetical protein
MGLRRIGVSGAWVHVDSGNSGRPRRDFNDLVRLLWRRIRSWYAAVAGKTRPSQEPLFHLRPAAENRDQQKGENWRMVSAALPPIRRFFVFQYLGGPRAGKASKHETPHPHVSPKEQGPSCGASAFRAPHRSACRVPLFGAAVQQLCVEPCNFARCREAVASWRKVGEAAGQQLQKSDKWLKSLALPRGIEPLFQP